MADNSATSGGTGDVLRTEDTQAATNTGVLGAKAALGKLLTGRTDMDGGAVSPDTPLDVVDWRLHEQLQQDLMTIVVLLDRIWSNERIDGVRTLPGKARNVTTVGVAGTLTSTQLAPADGDRLSLRIVNDTTSTGILYLRLGSGKATANSGSYNIPLTPGSIWEALPGEQVLAVQGVWATAAGFANVTMVA
jgi:hypothetical protein